ncbi:gliding motility-associated C-terminal domain-containing protein [Flavobacteriaceae bacterium GSB9]|nr:gliding motility-associated C-terminal domain-containing protein [Flavobacteriaceae bacterium GSB9]
MKKITLNRLIKVSSPKKLYLLLIVFLFMGLSRASADCTVTSATDLDNNGTISGAELVTWINNTGCSGTLTIPSGTQILLYADTTIPNAINRVVIEDGGQILWTANNVSLVLAPNTAIEIENTTDIGSTTGAIGSTTSSCSNTKRIFIGTTEYAACSGGGNVCVTFEEVIEAGGTIQLDPDFDVIAGSDNEVCVGPTDLNIQLNGFVDGSPTYYWEQISGPGTVTFSATDVPDPTINVDVAGDYVLRINVSVPLSTACEETTIDVYADVEISFKEGVTSTPVTTTPSTSNNCGLSVDFQAGASNAGPNTTYTWDFGDGTPVSNEQNPTHTYAANGTYNYSLTVIDPDGIVPCNELTINESITLNYEEPTITCPGDITVNNDSGTCNAIVNYTTPVGASTTSGVSTSLIAGLPSGATFPIGNTVVTYEVTDSCGNSTQCSFNVTVNDNTPPTGTAPSDISNLQCIDNIPVADIEEITDEADNCGGTVTVTVNDSNNGGAGCVGDPYIVTRTYTLADPDGNTTDLIQTITVEDNIAPTITTEASNSTVECSSSNGTEFSDWLNNNGGATASDSCGSVTWTKVGDTISDECGITGAAVVTFRATDECGNFSETTATFTIEDTTDPTWDVAPSDMTVQCDGTADPSGAFAAWLTSFSGSDSCGNATVTNNSAGLSDLCGATGSETVTFTLTDECGNDISAQATFTIEDTTDPTWDVAPSDMTVQCDGTADPSGAFAAWLTSFSGSDSCGNATVTNNSAGLSDLCGATGSETVTFTLTDECGNDISAQATFTIEDTTDPTWDVAPSDMTVQCDGTADPSGAFAAWLTSFSGSDSCGNATVTNNSAGLSDLCGATGSETVTFTLTDECGNDITAQATFTIEDTTDPTWDVAPSDMTVQCDGTADPSGAFAAWLTSFSGSDSCGNATVTHNSAGLSDLCGATGSETVTFTLTDECGNDITAQATFTIEDTTDPTWDVAPSDMTVQCDGTADPSGAFAAWLTSFSGSDSCGNATVTHNSAGLSDLCGATGSETVTFTLTDECGNDISAQATFTIEDTTDPTWDVAPSDMTVQCDGTADPSGAFAAWLTSFSGSDSCGNATVTNNSAGLSDLCGATGSETVTFTLTDECGNDITAQATFTIEDTTDPTWDVAPSDMTVQCDGTADPSGAFAAWLTSFSGSDSCGNATVTHNSAGLSDLCGATGSETVTFTLTDECGNDISAQATFTIEDTTDPTWDVAPSDMTVQCDGTADPSGAFAAWLTSFSGSDSCGNATVTNNSAGLSDLCGATGSETVTFTLTDECGNDITAQATFTIEDTTDPTWDVAPSDMTVQCDGTADPSGAFAAWLTSFSGSDSCGNATVTNNSAGLSDLCGATGSETVTFTLTDECGNDITAQATFTIEDTTDPTWDVAPSDMTVQCDGTADPSGAFAAWLTSFSGSDSCGNATVTHNSAGLSDLCGATGSETVTFTLTDECGNDITAQATFTIEDTTDPTWDVAPSDMTVQCDGTADPSGAFAAWLTSFSGSDSCGNATVTNNSAGLSDLCGATGSETVTFTLTDECGNDITAQATFTIEDTTDPTWDVAPSDMTVQCDGTADPSGAFAAWLTSFSGSDSCGNATVTHNSAGLSDLCGATGSETVTFTLTDECGNDITAQATFTIEDTTDPTIDIAATNIEIECGVTDSDALQNWLNNNGGATASDNCSEITWTNDYGQNTAVDCDGDGIVVTFTATDACNNSSSTTATYIIKDTTAPDITTEASAYTTQCDGSGNTQELNDWLTSNGGATATDNCSTITWSNNFTSLIDDCGNTGSATVIFTAKDACGNTSETTATFTIQDTTAPTFVEALPADATVECDAVPTAETLTASDNCGTATVTFNEVRTDGDCPSSYSLARTWTATDECGLETVHTQTITVQDTTAPTFVEALPADATVECDAVPTAETLTATDNCGTATVTFNEVRTDGDCPSSYTLERTWTATDECGLETVHTQTITVQDTTAPTFVEALPADATVECDAVPTAETLTATDNCGTATVTFNEVRNDGDCPSSYSLARTWTATDECGLETVHTQTITVQDTTAPTFVEALPTDTTVECDAVPTAETLTATDNCGTATVTFNEVRNDGDCPSSYSLARTWTATDECGLETVHTQTITVQDTTAPTFVEALPADATVECDAVPTAETLTASDNCGTATVTFNEVRTDGDCPSSYSLARTWTATDECGLETVHTQTITVQDTTAPTFVEALPADATVECDAVPTAETLTATDNCGTATVTFNEVRTDGDCPSSYSLARTWTATDECGLETVHTQTITVQDTTAPTFVEALPADATVECDAVPTAETLTATDNCGTATVTFNEVRNDGDCPSSYSLARTWTATDECGLETVHTQTITVQDTTAPTFVEALPADATVECDAVPTAETLTATDNCGTATVTFNEVRTDGDCPSSYTLERTWTATDECGLETVHTQTITVQDTTAPTFVEALPTDTTVECDAVPTAETLTATDNCGTATVTFNEVRTDGNCPSSYSLARTWTATDECGLETVHTQTITVQDTTAPTFVEALPADATVECDAVPTAETLTATDNCGTATVTFNEVRTDGDCPSSYTLERTWTATDECGLETVHTQTITVQDTTAPTFVEALPTDTTVECDAVPTAETLTATDNCGTATVTFNEVRTDGDCPSNYTLERTWTATDECGLETVHTQTITVQDTTAPTFVEALPTDTTVECDAVPTAETLTATDNCGTATVTVSDIRTDGNCANTYTIARTWTATDECGLETAHTQIITVQDTTPPTFVEALPRDITVECDAIPEATTLTATDNCGNATVTVSDARTNGNCANTYIIVRTWTATDECGLTTTHTQNISVEDTTAPVPTTAFQETINTSCIDIGNAPELEFTDNCSTNVTVEFEEINTFDETVLADYQVIRTWTVSDACSNEAIYTQTVNVSLDEVYTEIDTSEDPRCFDDGTVNLRNFLSDNTSNGTWEIIEGNPIATINGDIFDPTNLEDAFTEEFNPNTEGITYVLRFTGLENGCINITDVTMVVDAKCKVLPCGEDTVIISKAVTPNGDGYNDTFDIAGIDLCGFVAEVKIFNRWGALVFESNNYTLGSMDTTGSKGDWDGSSPSSSFGSAGKLPNGTYYYIINLRDSGRSPLTGPVYLGTK